MPQWDRQKDDGSTEHARLDVVFSDTGGVRTYVDVAVVSASSDSPNLVENRARTDGCAAATAVTGKRNRYKPAAYPGASLVPFVVEALGRPSDEAASLLQALAPKDGSRSQVLGAAYQSLSVVVQTRLAELLLSSKAGDNRPA